MALLTMERVRPLLVCPRCRSALVAGPAWYRCGAAGCPYHRDESFPVIGPWPVLVDWERSILRRESLVLDGASLRCGTPRARLERLPAALRGIWKPLNRVAVRNVDRLVRLLPGPEPTLLVVGGATVGNGVGALYEDPRVQVIGFDIEATGWTQFVADAHRIPLADGSVDGVLVQAVLEHVLDPALVVAEIHRVLRPHGPVYAETPFLQQVHGGAYDFTRFTASGHRYAFRWFEEIDSGPVAGPGTQLLWSIDYLVRGLARSATAGRLVRGLLFWLRYLDAVVPRGFAEDDASALYFLGRRSDHEMPAPEITAYYRGARS